MPLCADCIALGASFTDAAVKGRSKAAKAATQGKRVAEGVKGENSCTALIGSDEEWGDQPEYLTEPGRDAHGCMC